METLIDGYRVYLASNFALYLKTHGAHWNVTGMFFPQLHELFQKQYEDLWETTDTIAENIRKLDMFAPASLGEYKNLSVVDDQDGVLAPKAYIDRLLKDHERMLVLIQKVFDLAEAENRQADMNFLAERLDMHGKHRWFLRSLLHSVG